MAQITDTRDNDTLKGGKGSDVFVYTAGKDTITNYKEDDTIKISSGTVSKISTTKAGNVVFTVGSGKITVKNAADKIVTYEDADGVKNFYPIDFNAKRTSATLLSAYGKDEFEFEDFDGLKNLNASAVDRDLKIVGNKLANKIIGGEEYDTIDGGAGDDSINGGEGKDSIYGGTGNDTLTGGSGKDVFIYRNGDGNDIITDYEENDRIQIAKGKVSKISTTSAGSVVFTVGSGKITLKKAADKIITYEDADGMRNFYPIDFNAKRTSATLLSAYGKDEFEFENFDGLKNLDASKVTHALEIEGNELANKIIGTALADEIDGGKGADTLIGGKGNDTLKGGSGKDVFVYEAGDGNDTITDYTSGDKIQITSGTVSKISTTKAGSVVFKVGSGKITVKNAADKFITYEDADGVHIIPEPTPGSVILNAAGTAATLAANYLDDKFDAADYADTLATIDASAVNYDFEIVGNKRANKIIDGAGNDIIRGEAGNDTLLGGDGYDSLWGGAGNDILTGGDGEDSFIYQAGDGNDVITDYEVGIDQIVVINNDGRTRVESPIQDSSGNVMFAVGSGQIVVRGGSDKYIEIFDGSGNSMQRFIPRS